MGERLKLVRPGNILLIELPGYRAVLPFVVKQVVNDPYDELNYSPLPLTTSTALSYLIAPPPGAPPFVPENGVLPAESYNSSPVTFPLQNSFDSSDMFFFTAPNNKLILYSIYTRPRFLRVLPEIPAGVFISKFGSTYFSQAGLTPVSVGSFSGIASTGFFRGYSELVQLPNLHYGFIFANDTALTVYTSAKIIYQDIRVGIPDPQTAYMAMIGELYRNVVSVTLPVPEQPTLMSNALNQYYGTAGIPYDATLSEVQEIINKMKKVMQA